ncbi:MAG: response regulator, partial [Desulfuromonadaceae bacterium]|nr:response regulator [Desulfuromonadaceae bacterium]
DSEVVDSAKKRGGSGFETILVGEDNEDVRPMIVELLQDLGYRVLEARDGSEAVSLMEDFGDTVDMLLLDVIMPRMNGYDALAAIRQRYPEIPCLFLSGYSDDVLKQKANLSGDFEYLSKPILPDHLMSAVRSLLDGRRF